MGITAAVQEARANDTSYTAPAASTPIVGGPLDNAAEKVVNKAEAASKGWFGWIAGGSKKE